LGSKVDWALCLDGLNELSNSDLSILIGIELCDPGLNFFNISSNDASIVEVLDVVPKLIGLLVIEGLVLVGVVVSHDPFSNLLNLLFKLINFLNFF